MTIRTGQHSKSVNIGHGAPRWLGMCCSGNATINRSITNTFSSSKLFRHPKLTDSPTNQPTDDDVDFLSQWVSEPIQTDAELAAREWDDEPISLRRRLEAVLLMSRKPETTRKLARLAHLADGTQARTLIKELNADYDRLGRAFQIKRVAGGYQMLTRPQFSPWISRLEHVPRAVALSASASETLAVVAYRQPIIRAEIEAIRGVGCGEMLRQLLEAGLIKISGRSPELGRPFLYATTKDFLTCYGFNDTNQLPRAKQLAGQGLPAWASSDDNLEVSQ